MNLSDFLRLIAGAGLARGNPLSRRIWRGQLRTSQLGMLAAATLFLSGLMVLGKTHLGVRGELLLYIFLRWSLAEFFWIWMSADHLFSTVMGWKKRRAFDELRMTSLTPREIVAGFLGPALGFLLIGNTVHCLADAVAPYGRGSGLWSSTALFSGEIEDIGIWRIGLAAAFWFSAFGTTIVASTWSLRVAIGSAPGRVHANWLDTLVRTCLLLGTFNLVCLLAGSLCSAALLVAIQALGGSLPNFEASLVGMTLVIGVCASGFLKIWILGEKEWGRATAEMENYAEPEKRREGDGETSEEG